jgi:hypothetical protein
MNRTPVTEIEIHVVSNRDRVAQEIFDLRFQEFVAHCSRILKADGMTAFQLRIDSVAWVGWRLLMRVMI